MKLIEDQAEWNKLISDRGGSYLQSWEWGELQKNLGRKVIRFSEADFSTSLIKHKLPLGLNYFYVPRGPSGSIEKLEALIAEVKKLDERDRVIFLRVEPAIEESDNNQKILQSLGFKKNRPVQPQTTLALNLKNKEEKLYEEIDKDTRYAIRVALKRGVEILKVESLEERLEKFDEFWEIFEETNRRHGLKIYSKRYYQEIFSLSGNCRSKVFLAKAGDKTVSVALVIHFAKSAVYSLAASRAGYGKLNAPSLLLWRAILDAKASNLDIFDFWGIDEKNKKWLGITLFKKSFGGRVVKYIGTWDFVLNKKWYLLYRLIKKLG